MSKSFKRDIYSAFSRSSGRIPVIRKSRDYRVCHSKDCYMCGSGKRPKRLLNSKPDRRKQKQELLFELKSEGLA